MTWRLTIHIREDLPMPTARALVIVQDLCSIGVVDEVQPDVRADETLNYGEPLHVLFSGNRSVEEIKAQMRTFEGVTLEIEELPSQELSTDGNPFTLNTPPTGLVEELATLIVLSGPTDIQAIESMRGKFRVLSDWALEKHLNEERNLAEEGCSFLDQLSTPGVSRSEDIWQELNRIISRLQMLFHESSLQAATELAKTKKRRGSKKESSQSSVNSKGTLPASGMNPSEQDRKILADFLSRQPEVLAELESLALGMEKSRDNQQVEALLRILHTLKGDADLVGLSEVAGLCHWVEGRLKEGESQVHPDQILIVKDWLERYYAHQTGKGTPPESYEQLIASLVDKPAVNQPGVPASGVNRLPQTSPVPSFLDNPEMLETFVSESLEHLENSDIHLLTVETDPGNREALNAVFRAFHTVKGSAGILGLVEIGELAHEAENLLDRAREGSLVLAGPTIDVVFETIDCLKRMINRFKGRVSVSSLSTEDEAVLPLIDRIRTIESLSSQDVPDTRPSSLSEPRRPLGEVLLADGLITQSDLEQALRQQSEPVQNKRVGEILREMNITTKSKVETALELQNNEKDSRPIGEILAEQEGIPQEEIETALHKQAEPPTRARIGEVLVKSGQVAAQDVALALRAQGAAEMSATVQVRETVKVDADRLDQLLDTIGELVIAESMVSQSEELKHLASPALLRHLGQLDKITRELQEMGTSLRMIPIRATFQKMARLVRDLTRKSGKKVELVMSGEDTELDKTVVDQIGDPLVHMIRNAVDHGIESDPQERLRLGKPETGRIDLRAYHKGGSIYIEVQDDGGGLDRETILAKALERGLIREGDNLSDRDTFNLIFLPGFSTAKKVSDVSGRGVGMDVVKKNVEALRGQVDIMSEPGMGTLFTIRLPLTLAIIDGMVVRVSSERYIIPTLSIVQSMRPRPDEVSTVFRRGEMLKVQGDLIPLFRLDSLFVIDGAGQEVTQSTVVVVEDDGKKTGLMVDELLGQQQIVIKPLGEVLQGTPGLSGGAIMPDGQVGLILDIGALVRLATTNGNHTNLDETIPQKEGSLSYESSNENKQIMTSVENDN